MQKFCLGTKCPCSKLVNAILLLKGSSDYGFSFASRNNEKFKKKSQPGAQKHKSPVDPKKEQLV